jgi:hypothetical protein
LSALTDRVKLGQKPKIKNLQRIGESSRTPTG